MENIFKNAFTNWKHYVDCEIIETEDGERYVVPKSNAVPMILDVNKAPEDIVAGALACAKKAFDSPEETDEAILEFVSNYGMLGVMAALTDGKNAEGTVTVSENSFIAEDEYSADEFLKIFFPFGADENPTGARLTGRSGVYNYVLSKKYAEKAEWIEDFLTNLYEEFLGGEAEAKDFNDVSLMGIVEHCFSKLNAKQLMHECRTCGKFYIDEDEDSEACSEECQLQVDIAEERIFFNHEVTAAG